MFVKLKNYFTHSSTLNIELFKILGVGGVSISIVSCLYSLLTMDLYSALVNGWAGFLAIVLLYYVEKTGHYLAGYIIVEAMVFMLLFSVLFFTGSGMDGSMPYFFSFGLLFTFLMFEGKMLVAMESLLSLFYLGICLISIRFPQLVQTSGSSLPMNLERLAGVFMSAFSMGMIFLLYIREYKKQKLIAQEANRAKSIFLANMSHEIRTPINAVLGFNEIIGRTAVDAVTKEYSGYIEQSGRELLNVINEILDFSRMESGKNQLISENFSLRSLADEMKSLMAVMAGKKGLTYELDYDERLHDLVYGDREKLARILLNLLSNAFKYTNEGTVTLHIKLCEETGQDRKKEEQKKQDWKWKNPSAQLQEMQPLNMQRQEMQPRNAQRQEMQPRNVQSQKIYFAVEDTGIGIRISDVNNLFHAYERADLLKNRKIEGTGLGLAITEQLLHLFGSSVHVESTYRKGSTFSFEIILPEVGQGMEDVPESKPGQICFYAPDAKILVVDDDEMNRRLMDSFLCLFHISADFARSGEECLEMVKKSTYHLLLMDYMMPGLDGVQTMQKIRSEENKYKKKELPLDHAQERIIMSDEERYGSHTPIIVLTADVTFRIDSSGKENGFDDSMTKPVDLKVLAKKLVQYIPKELVSWEQEPKEGESLISPEQYKTYEELLLKNGIVLADGLKLVNGDFSQYRRIAQYFVNNAREDMGKLQEALDEDDLTKLRLSFHSLKGKAGSIGAGKLKANAQELEGRCLEMDLEYVQCAADLVLLQWKRCAGGLSSFLEMGDKQPEGEKSKYEDYIFEDLVEELGRNLRLCQGRKAKEVVRQMKKSFDLQVEKPVEQQSQDSFALQVEKPVDQQSQKSFDQHLEKTGHLQENNPKAGSCALQVLDEIEKLIDEMEFEEALEKAEHGLLI